MTFKKGNIPWNKGRKGYTRPPRSKEWSEKIGKAQKGRISPMKGKKHSETARKKISKSLEGNKNKAGSKLSEEDKKKISEALRGRHHSEKTKRKMSESQTGRKHSEETKKKMSETKKGKPCSSLTKFKKGKEHPSWRGGISFEPYTIDWTKSLRRSIRERDKYICQLCGEPQNDRALSVHHIDYDKKNCNPENLITLCNKCHQRVNFNRKHWMKYFNNNNLKNYGKI